MAHPLLKRVTGQADAAEERREVQIARRLLTLANQVDFAHTDQLRRAIAKDIRDLANELIQMHQRS